ncbi:hypothetical protein NQ318_016012 [Aromia moschata]|uniref:Transposase n=1 Tax=Aromia moschata TaxID=1265417 RepID=A0AAV8XJJ0_9CUCU|nr:hypothetical protein NQ318_016012 [Aromia moschata]
MIREAYMDSAMSYSQVSGWLKAFNEGREEVHDEQRSGRPSTSKTDNNLARVRQLLHCDRQLSIKMVANELKLSSTVVFRIVTEDLAIYEKSSCPSGSACSPSQRGLRRIDLKTRRSTEIRLDQRNTITALSTLAYLLMANVAMVHDKQFALNVPIDRSPILSDPGFSAAIKWDHPFPSSVH